MTDRLSIFRFDIAVTFALLLANCVERISIPFIVWLTLPRTRTK